MTDSNISAVSIWGPQELETETRFKQRNIFFYYMKVGTTDLVVNFSSSFVFS
jgi:hypothetical protein